MTAAASVSVVIPFFRSHGTIARALGSVAEQTHAALEVIVVDDASGEASAECLAGLAAAWPGLRLRLVSLRDNQGAAAARNAGWNEAQGEYIAFLDADDAWHPRKLEVQCGYMQAHAAVDVCGHGHTVAPASQSCADAGALPPERPAARRIGRTAMLARNPFVTPSVMLRSRVTLRFTPGQRHMEDHRLWMRMVLAGLTAVRLDAPLATLFKPAIGAGGLSGDILKMQAADMGNYRALRGEGAIGPIEAAVWLAWSGVKFVRRLIVLGLRTAGGHL